MSMQSGHARISFLGDEMRMTTLLSIKRITQIQVETLTLPMLTSKLSVSDAPYQSDLEERRPIVSEKHQDMI